MASLSQNAGSRHAHRQIIPLRWWPTVSSPGATISTGLRLQAAFAPRALPYAAGGSNQGGGARSRILPALPRRPVQRLRRHGRPRSAGCGGPSRRLHLRIWRRGLRRRDRPPAGRLPDPPHEIVALGEYRRPPCPGKVGARYAGCSRAGRLHPRLGRSRGHQRWLACGAQNHQPETEGDWATRKAAAMQAYFEWMPIRDPEPGRAAEAIFRSFEFGDLATLAMVETRLLARPITSARRAATCATSRAGSWPLRSAARRSPARPTALSCPASAASLRRRTRRSHIATQTTRATPS